MNFKKIVCKSIMGCCLPFISYTQKVYEINVNVPEMKIYSDHLKLGGTNPKGEKIAVNNHYVTINNKPFIPITGEFHFSRYSNKYWDESIKKMKAGGINVIATYVFWNMHEENEGKFKWTDDRDLRRFIGLCAKNNVYAIVRVGPFAHGEIRNGGLPDWLLGKPLSIRSDDRNYLQYVERFYNDIGKQLKGLYYKDGGNIIGIQIENEYQHSAAPWGLTYPGQPNDMTAAERDLSVTQEGVGVAQGSNPYASLGNDHMKILKSLAIKAGMNVPLYTATGWGNAAIIPNESIPVTAAYAYPFWTPKRDLSPFFLYKDMHKSPDYSPVRYKPEDYPAFPAELGSGIMSIYTRRPIAVHKSMDAMINRCIGSGANGVGYYMYHGGSTPKGEHYYFSDEAYGLPKISYDFQAPIGEFGQVREGFHRLKLLHFFLKDFSDVLGPTQTVIAENASKLKPDNIDDLRYAARVKGSSGFLFITNFQDDTVLTEKKNIQIKVKTASDDISFPESGGFTLKSDENVIFPFNFNLNGINLNYATAQLLMKGDDANNPYYVFFAPEGIQPQFSFITDASIDASTGIETDKKANRILVKCNDNVSEFTVSLNGRNRTRVLVLPKTLALRSYVVMLNGKKHLMFSDAVVLQDNNSFNLLSDGKNNYGLSVYPKINLTPKIDNGTIIKLTDNKIFSAYNVSIPEVKFAVQSRSIGQKKYVVELPTWNPQLNDLFLTIDYTGDTGMGFLNGELVTDEFYKGIPWQIGLRNFISNTTAKEMVFYFRPMYKNASYLIDLQPYPSSIPDFGDQRTYLKINSTHFTPKYKTIVKF